MRRLFLSIPVFLLLAACSNTLPAGIYSQTPAANDYSPQHSATTLSLHADSTFTLSLLDPLKDSLLLGSRPGQCFSLKGRLIRKGKNDFVLSPGGFTKTDFAFEDSITHFTNISSFQFLDRYGNPIAIRSIRFGRSRPKPHYGNSLYFFAQDFQPTDTIRFAFDGYPEFSYPGSVNRMIGNNAHKMNFYDPFMNGGIGAIDMRIRGSRLYLNGTSVSLNQKK